MGWFLALFPGISERRTYAYCATFLTAFSRRDPSGLIWPDPTKGEHFFPYVGARYQANQRYLDMEIVPKVVRVYIRPRNSPDHGIAQLRFLSTRLAVANGASVAYVCNGTKELLKEFAKENERRHRRDSNPRPRH